MNQLHTQVCFEALSVLNNVQYVESVCNLCGNSHYTGNCPEIGQGTYVPDTPPQSFSRSSVPNGLLVMDTENGTCVITSQKFAKGTRFGPLLAEKSYISIKGVAFPLTIFPTPLADIAEFETLYNGRNIYLDTRDENKCNWMIHVNTANYSNEQNLNAYQHNDSIYYVAIQDIELGDILKVWYSPIYAVRMGVELLKPSPYNICNNLLRQVSMDYGIKIDDMDPSNPSSVYSYPQEHTTSSEKDREIALPPVISLMKITSPNYSSYNTAPTTSQHVYDLNTPHLNQMHLAPAITPVPINSFDNAVASMYDCGGEVVQPLVPQPMQAVSVSGMEKQHHHQHHHHQQQQAQELMDISMTGSGGDVVGVTADLTDPSIGESQQDATKFACEVCNRKYATKLTLEKHLRTHELFLCIVCDKLYHSLADMQDHECYKKRNKTRPLHCNICLKLLSNSWSLTRHMKIHRNEDKPNSGAVTPLTPSTIASTTTPTPTPTSTSSSSDEKNLDDEFLSSVLETEPCNPPHQVPIEAAPKPKVPGKRLEEPMECIVCRRPFKNPNALDKHLKFVHTVSTDGARPMYKKYAQEARMKQSLTNNTAPVKPAIAKALASKLSQKKKNSQDEMHGGTGIIEGTANTSATQQQQNDNTIIIFEVTQLTEDNMYDTNQLLNGAGTQETSVTSKLVNGGDAGAFGDAFQGLQPSIICNGTPADTTNMLVPGTSEVLVDVPKMIVLKKGKKGEPSAFRASSGDILNLDNGAILRKEEPSSFNCDDCKKTFAKKYQLKRHQETHDSIFYTCPYCDKAPLKARSSLKKHFSREHNDKIHEWNTSNFLSKQILRDEEKLRELRKKYHEKKRLHGDKLVEAIHRAMNTDDVTSTTSDSLDSLVEDLDNNNIIHNGDAKRMKRDAIKGRNPQMITINNNNNKKQHKNHNHNKMYQQTDDHEMIENLFDNLINDNLLDPLNGNDYDGDDDHMHSVNYIQETFQNSFKEIQEKLDADLEVGSEQIKWEENLKSDDSSDEIMSDKLLDENVMLI